MPEAEGVRSAEMANRLEAISGSRSPKSLPFVDAHCHILPAGLDLLKLNLSPLDTREAVLDAVRDARKKAEGWLHAVQYDQTKYGNVHLTRNDLDAVDAERPILLRHSNGHASVANSAALRSAGVSESEADPPGGEFRRDADGRIDGVLLETAHERVTAASPRPTREGMVEAILRAGRSMADFGIVAAADMMTGRFDLADEVWAYEEAAKRGNPIETRLWVQWSEWYRQDRPEIDLSRVSGLKLFADGAIGSASAAMSEPYASDPTNYGTLIYEPDELRRRIQKAAEDGWRVAVHAIGDRASALVLDCFANTPDPLRHRLEHAMLPDAPQIAKMAKLQCEVGFQPEFLMRFGHAYRRQLGPERTWRLKPAQSLLEAGVRLSFASDRPIVPGDPMDGIRTAVRRPEGFDPGENIDEATARRLYSEDAARAMGLGRFEDLDRPDLGLVRGSFPE
ncbi:amidohydrolase [soil metagenome]